MEIVRDLEYAARTMRKNPAFAATALITIALGIGVSTAIFSVVNTVLLRPLPYADADRLTLIWGDMRNRNVKDFPFPPGDFADLRKEATMFEGFAGVQTFRQSISGDQADRAEPEQISAGAVTTNFFSLLGARIALGRDFTEADGAPQPPPPPPGPNNAAPANQPPPPPAIVILSHEFWQRRFGGDPNVVGRSIDLGGGRAQVIGVLAPGFELLFPPDTNIDRHPQLWTAMRVDFENGSRINVFLRVIGKLKPSVTLQQAQVQLDGIATELRQRFPIKQTAGLHFRIEPMYEDLVADVRPAILALMGAVMFVLLIACANVANLLLVRASWREREFAVRAALGGSRWRLVRQMLAESLVLGLGGALLGLLLAKLGIDLLLLVAPENLPRIDAITIDWRVLSFTTLAALIAAVVFGIAPALRASRPNVMEVLRRGGRTAGLGGGRLLRNSVVMVEVALSFVLLIGSGLMMRSFIALLGTDPGYDPNHVLTFFIPNVRAQGQDGRTAFMRNLRERLRALPGVQAVTATNPLPLDGRTVNARWGTEEARSNPGAFQQANVHIVLPGYFETMRTRLIEGRTFTEADNAPEAKVIVVDQRLAARAFPNQSAVGKRLLSRIRTDEPELYEIIGVVAHQRHNSLAADGREAIFFTDAYLGSGAANRWVVRTDGDPTALAAAVRTEVARLNPLVAVAEVQPMLAFVERARAQTRFALVLIGVFAGIAVILAAVGLYGVLSTVVRQRTAEIGVRMALGATPSVIFRSMVGQGLRLSGVGIGIGLVAAFALTRVMTSMLVGVTPTDPLTFVTIAAFFFGIAAVASWLPARRAAGLDPTIALRDE